MFKKIVSYLTLQIKLNVKFITIILPMFILGVFLLSMTLNNIYTKTYDIERFNRAKETIRSPITVENEQETKRKTRETVQSIEDRYDISVETTEERIEYIEEIFDAIEKLEKEKIDKKKGKENQEADDKDTVHYTSQEKVQQLGQILSTEINEEVNDTDFIQLIRLESDERKDGEKLLIASLRNVLNKGVRTENLQSALAEVKQEIKYAELDADLQDVLNSLAEFAVVENSFFDPEATSSARKDAASSVEPVIIRAGEIIVREGQTITNEIYEELKLAGLLNKERNIYPVLGLILLITLIVGFIGYEMNQIDKKGKLDKGKIISIFTISIIVITLMKVVSLFTDQTNHLYYIVPVATGTLLVKQLIGERLSIVLASLYAIIGSVIFNGEIPGSLNVEAGVYFFFSQIAAIVFLRNVKDRLAIVRAGIGMGIVNIITVLLFILISFEKYTLVDLLTQSGFAVVSALLSAVLTLGLLPFFETSLGILSDIKLLQLSSPNQRLLQKLLVEAPGTYHHSIMVANLSETACEAIGANGLLARVGSYYHDIGKTLHPHYFIENQVSIKNPHDMIEPIQSAEIIIKHPYEGAELLRKERLPKEIIDIAEQHHGTTLLKYFYYKDKESNKHVQEEDYRYPGPKPQTKEAAIICICDSVEAAVRSLKEPTKDKIDEIVSAIINDRLMDGQLDQTPLTIRELNTVHSTICDTLKGIFHSRIQYPMKEAK